MTEQKKPLIKYFDRETLELIHSMVSEQWKVDGEPIPPFSTANEHNVDGFIKIPQSKYFGIEQYPTLESKAAIIFYTLNKKHLFSNGNKRISVACLLIFLLINGKRLVTENREMTEKALELAKTSYDHDFNSIKKDLEAWIRERLEDFDLRKIKRQ